ncbi:putative leader peptide [Streptomyces sp. NPDC054784]
MVVHDVSAFPESGGTSVPGSARAATGLLGAFGCGAARLHVDLCRLASATCPGGRAAARARGRG